MTKIKYNYSDGNLLSSPQKYQMSPFEGSTFLQAYKLSRQTNLSKITKNSVPENPKNLLQKQNTKSFENLEEYEKIETEELLRYLFLNDSNNKKILLDKFVKKFEIKKRLYSSYNNELKEISENYSNLKNYILLSVLCILEYEKTRNLKYLNAALKVNDTICSQINSISDNEDKDLIQFSIKKEIDFVTKLEQKP